MRVAIVGSFKEDPIDFSRACRQLGCEIVNLGHSLLIGSERQYTADYHVVEGIVQNQGVTKTPHPHITVFRRNDGKIIFAEYRKKYPWLFSSVPGVDKTWEINHLFQVKECDALVVIGGAERAFPAGLTAAVAGKIVIPIGGFGGAGLKLGELFFSTRDSWLPGMPTRDQLSRLREPWTDEVLKLALQLLNAGPPKLMIVHGRSDDRLKLKNYLQNTLKLPEPVIMGEHFTPGNALPEKFEQLAAAVNGAIALVTPDEAGAVVESDRIGIVEQRARQNVWLEAGWFWGRLGRRRFLLLCKDKTVIPSDLQGIEYFKYESDPSECGENIRAFIDDLKGTRK